MPSTPWLQPLQELAGAVTTAHMAAALAGARRSCRTSRTASPQGTVHHEADLVHPGTAALGTLLLMSELTVSSMHRRDLPLLIEKLAWYGMCNSQHLGT